MTALAILAGGLWWLLGLLAPVVIVALAVGLTAARKPYAIRTRNAVLLVNDTGTMWELSDHASRRIGHGHGHDIHAIIQRDLFPAADQAGITITAATRIPALKTRWAPHFTRVDSYPTLTGQRWILTRIPQNNLVVTQKDPAL